jgi:hypothetical protein
VIKVIKIKTYLLSFVVILLPCMLSAGETTERMRNFMSFSQDNIFFPLMIVFAVLLVIASFFYPRFGLIVMMFFMLMKILFKTYFKYPNNSIYHCTK